MSVETAKTRPLGRFSAWKRESRATVGIAWPLSLAYLGQMAISTTDVIMIGRLGKEELAAAAISTTVFLSVFMLSIGVIRTVTPLASQYLGARKPRLVRRVVRQGLWACVAVSIPSLILLWFMEPILVLLRQQEELIAPAGEYTRAFMWAFLPATGYIALRSFMTALERPKPAMAVMAVCVVANAVLNYGLIYGNFGLPRLELVGAGIASSLTNTLMFLGVVLITAFMRPFRRYNIYGRLWRPDWPLFRQLFRVGLPVGVTNFLEEGLFSASMLIMGFIGVREVAAHTIAVQWVGIFFMISVGIADATCSRVGHAAGRGDLPGVQRAGWNGVQLAVILMVGAALLFWIFPDYLAAVFLDWNDPDNAEVLQLAALLLGFAAAFQIFDGTQLVTGGALHGLSDTKVPMFFAVLGYWGIGMTMALVFAFWFDLGAQGVWMGLFCGLAVAATCYVLRFRLLSQRPLTAPLSH